MKLNVMIRLAAILLCLVLFTTYLTFGLYAKYLSRAASNGTARVATFEIETDLAEGQTKMKAYLKELGI